MDPIKSLDALTCGMKQVEEGFAREALAIPNVSMATCAMKSAMPIVEEAIRRAGRKKNARGTVVIGTVCGDIHDIGKTMVATLLAAEGFQVVDLGVDVTAGQFTEAIREHKPGILAMSALTTIAVSEQRAIIKALEQKGLRDELRIMVGGGAVTQALAEEIGADGYESTALRAVGLAERLTGVM